MPSTIVQICVAMLLAWSAGNSWGAEPPSSDASSRYGHTRCVVLAHVSGPEQLGPLAEEIEYLRVLGAPEIVVVIAGVFDWPNLDGTSAQAAQRLRRSADQVLPEWRTVGEHPQWLAAFDPPVPSALLEAAYWQDRGYRLLPYQFRSRSKPAPPLRAPAEPAPGEPRLRFSW